VTKATVTVFTMPQCPKCPAAKELVKQVGEDFDIDIEEVDIKEDMVKALKKDADVDNPFAVAWAAHNKAKDRRR